MKTKLLKLLAVTTISITAIFALGITASAATAGDLTITLTDGGEPTENDYGYDSVNHKLTIKSDTPMTISGTSSNDIIFIDSGVDANLTLDNLSIDASGRPWYSAFEIGADSTGDVTITLVGDNKLKSGMACAGLQKSNTEYSDELGMLTIKGTGSLTATGGSLGAGIGGGGNDSGSNITIEGGTVTAQGGERGAGIGGGEGYIDGAAVHGEYITIRGNAIVNATGGGDEYGGGAGIGGGGVTTDGENCKGGNGSHIKISENAQVTATGGEGGAGIGGGDESSGNNITIEGGTVIAQGGEGGAGIGGGEGNADGTVGHGEYITIRGNAIVTATGGEDSAGIGGGYQGNGNNITIEGGTVTAKGGEGGAGIGGGGGKGKGSYITISGGTITATGGINSAGIGGGGSKSNGSYITIEGGTVTAQGGTYSAGIGSGYRGSADNIKISGGTVKAVAGVGDEKNGTTYFPAAIGQGVQYNESTSVYSDGAEVTPTDGTDNVYLLELDVDGTSAVTINGKAYPTKHFDENKVYIYLPAKTAADPNEVAVGNETTKYCYINAKWLKVVDSPEADDTEFTYDGTEKTYTFVGSDYCTITGDKQINVGTYTVTVALNDKDNTVWNDGTTDDKTFTFTIAKATVTVTANSYTIKVGEALPTYAYDVTGLVNDETLPIDVTISCTADGNTAGAFDIVVSGVADSDNYAFAFVNGKLTVVETSAGGETGGESGGTEGGTGGSSYIPSGPTTPTHPTGPLYPDKDDETAPQIKGENGKQGWDVIEDEIKDAEDGDKITVDMNGATEVPKDIFKAVKGKDIDLVIELDNGFKWTINGKDVTKPADIDLGVNEGSKIPAKVINAVTGGCEYITLTLSHNGDFGFKAMLTVDLGEENEGMYANLYYVDSGKSELICSDKIDGNGRADLTFTHASEYIVVIDVEAHGENSVSGDTDDDNDDSVSGDNVDNDDSVSGGSDGSADSADDDENPPTGMAVSFAGVIIAGAAAVMFKKRK